MTLWLNTFCKLFDFSWMYYNNKIEIQIQAMTDKQCCWILDAGNKTGIIYLKAYFAKSINFSSRIL
jgi:hypothetical protein